MIWLVQTLLFGSRGSSRGSSGGSSRGITGPEL